MKPPTKKLPIPTPEAGSSSKALTAIIGLIKAKEDPRYEGAFPLVMMIKAKVPIPLVIRATAGLIPVSAGTNTVAPNIAKRCWMLRTIHWINLGRSSTPKTTFFSSFVFIYCLFKDIKKADKRKTLSAIILIILNCGSKGDKYAFETGFTPFK